MSNQKEERFLEFLKEKSKAQTQNEFENFINDIGEKKLRDLALEFEKLEKINYLKSLK